MSPETVQNRMFWTRLQGWIYGVSPETYPAAGESITKHICILPRLRQPAAATQAPPGDPKKVHPSNTATQAPPRGPKHVHPSNAATQAPPPETRSQYIPVFSSQTSMFVTVSGGGACIPAADGYTKNCVDSLEEEIPVSRPGGWILQDVSNMNGRANSDNSKRS